MRAEKIDPKTGTKWRSVDRFYETYWFELVVIFACFAFGGWTLMALSDIWWSIEGAQIGVHNLNLAQSLMEGRGFVGEGAIPDTVTPPFYPLLLAMVMAFFGTSNLAQVFEPILWMNLLVYLLSIVFVYRFAGHQFLKPYPLIVTAVFALAPITLLSMGQFTGVMVYTALSFYLITVIDKRLGDESKPKLNRWGLIEIIIVITAAIATTPAGISLLLAFLLVLLKSYGIQRALMTALVVGVLLLPWYFRSLLYPQEGMGVSTAASVQQESLLVKTQHVLQTAAQQAIGVQALVPFRQGEGSLLSGIGHLDTQLDRIPLFRGLILFLLTVGVLYGLYHLSGFASWYLLLFMLGFILAPFPLSNLPRYMDLVPVFPLILTFTYGGFIRICSWMKPHHLKMTAIAGTILTTLIVVHCLGGYLLYMRGL